MIYTNSRDKCSYRKLDMKIKLIALLFFSFFIATCSTNISQSENINVIALTTNTPEEALPPTIESTITPSVTEVSFPNYPSGEIILHEAGGEGEYNYWSYVPKNLPSSEETYILLDISHPQIEDYHDLTAQAKYNISMFVEISEKENFILLTPVIPRDFSEGYYPQGINEYSLNPSTPFFFYRPDLKVNIIIDQFVKELDEKGYSVNKKIFVSGFSAGGMWANRYTLLHPERVKAAAIGSAGGWLTMPVYEFNGINLRWPLGLYNYLELTGNEYDKFDALKSVPMLIYIGDEDTESTYFSKYPSHDLINIWGISDPDRFENQYKYLVDIGYDVSFKLYPNVAHRYTDQMILDVINFLVQNK